MCSWGRVLAAECHASNPKRAFRLLEGRTAAKENFLLILPQKCTVYFGEEVWSPVYSHVLLLAELCYNELLSLSVGEILVMHIYCHGRHISSALKIFRVYFFSQCSYGPNSLWLYLKKNLVSLKICPLAMWYSSEHVFSFVLILWEKKVDWPPYSGTSSLKWGTFAVPLRFYHLALFSILDPFRLDLVLAKAYTFVHVPCSGILNPRVAVSLEEENQHTMMEQGLFMPTQKVLNLRKKLLKFLQEQIYPRESEFYSMAQSSDRWTIHPEEEKLKLLAKQEGLWNLWIPVRFYLVVFIHNLN